MSKSLATPERQSPILLSSIAKKLTQKKIALRAKTKSKKSTKTPKNQLQKTHKKQTKKQKQNGAYAHENKIKINRAYARKLTRRTKKIIYFPAPFKGAQERGIAALSATSPNQGAASGESPD